MGAFDAQAFGPGFDELLASGDPAFQGAAFGGASFHVEGEAPAEEVVTSHPSLGVIWRPTEPVSPVNDDEELLLVLV